MFPLPYWFYLFPLFSETNYPFLPYTYMFQIPEIIERKYHEAFNKSGRAGTMFRVEIAGQCVLCAYSRAAYGYIRKKMVLRIGVWEREQSVFAHEACDNALNKRQSHIIPMRIAKPNQHTHTHTHIHIYIYTYVYTYTHMYIHIHELQNTHIRKHCWGTTKAD